ncbi:MAG: hypothetical protein KJ661_07560 [Candidatus Omnitrophica bacterium]|nr:hypothetical protein [Candidatus Omnitrophota bacterium]
MWIGNLKNDKVWYAVYGTNLNEQRFSCYIKGGTPEGANRADVGCHDKTMAIDGGEILIPLQLYFAKKSPRWDDKAVGFLNSKVDLTSKTLGRKYLITKDQFNDIFKQENNIDLEEKINIDFNDVIKKGTTTLKKSWYGKIILLGEEKRVPIVTLTAYWDYKYEDVLSPSAIYLRHIIRGINQTYKLSADQVLEYLYQKPGLAIIFSRNKLLEVIKKS